MNPTEHIELWLDNDEGLWNACEALAQDAREAAESSGKDPVDILAQSLQDFIEDQCPQHPGTVWADLLTYALAEVDYREIAEGWLAI